ncbi:EAL domain-containing protein [Psychrobacillus sp. NPDC058041]|uniref:bifunctional diguanylate cyclase/phosphodiesterase n=1 Tax=Psychrobacillus sp. NPDC058041 TaxID=3346310 RepID=UPI0036DECE73
MLDHPLQNNLIELHAEYSFPVVILSIILACITSYTALLMNNRVQKNSFIHRNFWYVFASIAMGFGIWTMHFVGMFAFSLPVAVYYHRISIILSIIPAIVASFIAFYLANHQKKSIWYTFSFSVIIGIGISTCHFVSMIGMKTDAIHTNSHSLIVLSILISIFIPFLASISFFKLRSYIEGRLLHLLMAISLGVAISSTHYTYMVSTKYYLPNSYAPRPGNSQLFNMDLIVVIVTIGMTLLLIFLLLSSLMDKYIEYRASYYDALTKLPNRRLFEKKIKKTDFPQSLAIWHLHDLELVNREFDYQFGDKVIQQLSFGLKTLVPPMTELYRIDGHRFAFLTHDIDGVNYLSTAMENVAKYLSKPLIIDNFKINIQAVCAISRANNSEESLDIFTKAQAVLNYSSIEYNYEIIHYDSTIHTYAFGLEVVEDIGQAMEKEELFLVYQPKVNVITNKVIGVETLLRWDHPAYGFLSPGVFIPILEENNRMIEVTNWIIEKVCRQMSIWRKEGISFQQVAINIPGQYVTSNLLLDVLKSKLNKYKLEPSLLELEITETSFVKNIEEAMRAVNTFRQEGFSVALDDFGTGVSSLSYLKKMPISTLKIDKSFIDDVPQSEKDSSIIQAIIALGESLDLAIVFEGVETKRQVDFLATTCENPIIQGYYFAKPMKADELFEWNKAFEHA